MIEHDAKIYHKGRVFTRRINSHNLSMYKKPNLPGSPHKIVVAIWYVVNAIIFQGSILGLLPSSLKSAILRLFGAKIGQSAVIKPRVSIKYPWFLHLGDHVWIGELVWIDNHTAVNIGNNVCISQAVYICTGNHDWNDISFGFFCKPIVIGDGCWIGARTMLGPGAIVENGTVIASQ